MPILVADFVSIGTRIMMLSLQAAVIAKFMFGI